MKNGIAYPLSPEVIEMIEEEILPYKDKKVRITLSGSEYFFTGIIKDVKKAVVILENKFNNKVSISRKNIASVEEYEGDY